MNWIESLKKSKKHKIMIDLSFLLEQEFQLILNYQTGHNLLQTLLIE